MRLLIRACIALLILAVVAVVAYLYMPAIGSFSNEALNHSVTDEAGGNTLFITPCRKHQRHVFRCEVPDRGGSGGAVYVVKVDGHCWKARRQGAAGGFEGKLARRVSGCVKWHDQFRPFDRIL